MTVPDPIARQLRSIRAKLSRLDSRRSELVQERDVAIREARAQGGSLREVADLAGISHVAVRKIEERDTH